MEQIYSTFRFLFIAKRRKKNEIPPRQLSLPNNIRQPHAALLVRNARPARISGQRHSNAPKRGCTQTYVSVQPLRRVMIYTGNRSDYRTISLQCLLDFPVTCKMYVPAVIPSVEILQLPFTASCFTRPPSIL